jgi:hypothetical protein
MKPNQKTGQSKKKRGRPPKVKPSESDINRYLSAIARERNAPTQQAFFLISSLLAYARLGSGALRQYITRPKITKWLRSNGYTCREVWPPGRHIRAWTKLSQKEFVRLARARYAEQ